VFAIDRAHRVLAGIDIDRLLSVIARVKPRPRHLAAGFIAMVLGLGVGAIDRLVVERAMHPMTARETAAASALERATADAAQAERERAPDPKTEAVLDAARRASDAAKRGDRRAASEALEDMRKAARALERDEREQARGLRSLRDELEASA